MRIVVLSEHRESKDLSVPPSPPRPRPPHLPRLRLLPFALSYAECARYLHTPVPSATMNSMTTRDFKVFLEPDQDYGGYVVVCPSIPGCYSQGKTVPEALANIREAIDLCLEDMESTPSW